MLNAIVQLEGFKAILSPYDEPPAEAKKDGKV